MNFKIESKLIFILVVISIIHTACFGGDLESKSSEHIKKHCSYNEEAMMAMSPREFDQNYEKGWQSIADKEGCLEAAANAIRKYYKAKNISEGAMKSLVWHEGQIKAELGNYEEAIILLSKTKKSEDEDDIGWNFYVDATIAFLKSDIESLKDYRMKLSQIPMPDGMPTVDSEGNPYQITWPPNLNVVDNFIICFGKPYSVAYGGCNQD